jgi:hypothetical protein
MHEERGRKRAILEKKTRERRGETGKQGMITKLILHGDRSNNRSGRRCVHPE